MPIVRKMRREDIGAVYRITCASLDQYYVPETFNFFILQWPNGQLVSCDNMGKPIGFLCGALLNNNRSTISLIAVDDRYRKTGVGDQLLKEFKMASVLHGCSMIQLEVRDSNISAREFYKKRGFIETEFLPDFYTDHGNAVRMMGSPYQNS
jgi:[ribosomal protein S18]-alanine N-acetyltransferase